uniref:Uncharacterized protein n=1 Tax=Tanacetum cinerariifolium TaxID=118510 RepID=A0A6L2JZF5_TANCI|nr:hypothetical protein [Tanacetum cinerariifolium]
MAKSGSSSENEVYDNSYCSKSCRKNTENLNTKIRKSNKELSDYENNLYHYKIGLSQVEARLVEFKKQEIKFYENIRGLERDVEVRNNKIEYLVNELEQVKKEKEGLDNKSTGFESVSKDLDNLLEVKDQIRTSRVLDTMQPPPSAQVYSLSKKDLSWTCLPEFIDDSVTDSCRPTPSIDKSKKLPPSICKMGKSNLNKKKTIENLNLFYQDIGPSSSAEGHLTQDKAAKEALAVRINQNFALLEEERLVIETIGYNDKYKKILDEIWKDKVELDGKTMEEEEDAVKRIKGEALKEKYNPGAFIFPIRLEGKVNKNALADTGSDINTMPYQIYETLRREEMKKIDKGSQ